MSALPASAPAPGPARVARWAREGVVRHLGVLLALALLVVWLTSTSSQFATTGNVLNILETNASLLILAVGLTFVMLVGGFDLSLGGLSALTAVTLATLLESGTPMGLAIAIVLAGALAAGAALNGAPIACLALPFFVVTLGTASLFRGLALVETDARTIQLYDEAFLRTIGAGRVAGIPWPVVIALTLFVVALAVLRYTNFGRMVYAVGGNAEAARLAGINVTAVRISAYAIAALLAGVAGIVDAGRLASASPTVATGIELTAAAAVMVGGTSLMGGVGGVFGTLLGVLFIGVLSNGLTLAGISSFWQGVVSGTVLILAVLFDRLRPGTP